MYSNLLILRNVAAIAACLAATAMILVSCEKASKGKDDLSEDDDAGGKLNPPAWFVGNWTPENGMPNEDITVTARNVTVSSGNLDFSFQIEREYLSDWKETLATNLYTLSYVTKNPAGTAVSYAFEPYEGGKIKRTITMTGFGVVSHIFIKKTK